MAEALLLAEFFEMENGEVEANNAQLRRRVKVALQQRSLSIQDLSVFWNFSLAKSQSTSMFGNTILRVEEAPRTADSEQPDCKMGGGGGGLHRLYYSTYCSGSENT